MAVRRKFFGASGYGGTQPPSVARIPAGGSTGQPQPGQGGDGQTPQRRPQVVAPQGPQPAGGPGMMTPQNVQPFLQQGGGSGMGQGMGRGPQPGQAPVGQADILQLLAGIGLI